MSILEIDGLSHAFADKELYQDASFRLNKEDHMGIIGQNGAGKSTLIKIITGQELPDEGKIVWQNNIKIGYLDQYAQTAHDLTVFEFLKSAFEDLYNISELQAKCYEDYAATMDESLLDKAGRYQEQLEAGEFYEIETKIEQVMSGLGIDAIGKDRQVDQCSGGQRSKIILAKLLLENPDVLLLDEPTNYLDVEHIEWLINYLNDFAGCFMVISHDFDFLERVTNTIIDVAFGKITKYTGSFSSAIKQKEVKKEVQLKAYEKQRRQIEKDEAYIRRNKAGTRSTMAKSRQKRLDKMERVDPPSDALQSSFSFPYEELMSSSTLVVENLSVGYERPLLAPVTFSMSHGEKVVLKGFNGVGKSTLIKSILGIIPNFGGSAKFVEAAKVNYFTQDLTWDDPTQTPLQIVQNVYPKLEPKTIRQRLARAGLSPANAMKPMELLSGGEQTKVKLCILELKPSNFLIMDEPTNHLDDETKNALKKALVSFAGNVLLVSHEQSFYDGWIDKIFDVESIRLNKN
ncbi:ABC-F family ATP-binding cassette domain-containing protein [Liquorilactobacillus mali]|uniref:ABC transporter ATP-binding protein n=1 Tax=Liquorilactobacillus mali KCTC 3596 = DSM 20444 TaxID=1046596 RepID=A0A0R2DZA0_9LACO|nr:ABC-F family ATP-binding cassette domain-containing protein [Liquorilactobacillus mali]KRN08694.1 ABC transporter ATP-binding protein [Liquorilactobacillus mali KCTC 3596 = DSM 20444]MDC7953649.1 ABC-F family ATP-binding cassette domain-containing protein [Liquorilactobacillus mali]MDV7758514.1 ATP-binding cassette domain-containing protein [Liquorilactobacillus mali]QFQ73819.1 ABC-F family ATP-binding cassette domain-containing protein [Liquorilactobacillus mali]